MSRHRAMNNDVEMIPQELLDEAEMAIQDTLPQKSRRIYRKTLDDLLAWMESKGTNSFAETVLLVYFKSIANNFSPASLWSKFSMIEKMLLTTRSIDITNYHHLTNFIKQKNVGYEPKKSKVFEAKQIKKFFSEAPDELFLDLKVSAIFGICGACRREELYNVVVSDVVDKGDHLFVTVPNTKTHITRTFTIDDEFCALVKKYINLRPPNATTNKFFLNYSNGHCFNQPIGINKLGQMPQFIARWLELDDPHLYTGHSFRRTSATLLANEGASITTLRRHGGWKSAQVAEGYIADSIENKRKISSTITSRLRKRSNRNVPSNQDIPAEAMDQDPTVGNMRAINVNIQGNNNGNASSVNIQCPLM